MDIYTIDEINEKYLNFGLKNFERFSKDIVSEVKTLCTDLSLEDLSLYEDHTTKFCSNCGKKLEENADICLNCGVLLKKNSKPNKQKKEKKKGLPIWAIVLIIIGCIVLLPIIVIVMVGIFAYNIVQDSDIDFDEYINDIVDEETTIYGTIDDTLNYKVKIIFTQQL